MQGNKLTERNVYKGMIAVLSALLVMLLLFNASTAGAATFAGDIEMPGTRVDGSILDISEIQSVTVECGTREVGPFDAHSVVLTQIEPVMSASIELPTDESYWCQAFVTDTVGRSSGPSNVVALKYISPPGSPILREFNMILNITFKMP